MGEYGLDGSDLAMEIASNDGYLLQHYQRCGVPVLGVDPAENVVTVADGEWRPTRCEFFDLALAEELRDAGSACVDTACEQRVGPRARGARGWLQGIARVLRSDGRAVIETPYVA